MDAFVSQSIAGIGVARFYAQRLSHAPGGRQRGSQYWNYAGKALKKQLESPGRAEG